MNITLLRQMRDASGLALMATAVAAKLHTNTVIRLFNGGHVSTKTTEAVASALRKALADQRRTADELLHKVLAA